MQTGTKISGVAHLILIGWAVFGASLEPEPLPFEVQEVSVISAEEFAAMTATPETPEVAAEPVVPDAPDPAAAPPELVVPEDASPERDLPDPAAQPEADARPEPPAPELPPDPEAAVGDTPPSLGEPDAQVAVVLPPLSQRPKPRPVERVAPVPVAPPPPDARPDEVENPAVVPEEGAGAQRDPQEATAPEAANDRIVTEADEGTDLAPIRSVRPPSRPARRTAAAPPEPKPADTQDAVRDALAEALGGTPARQVPSGPPLTSGEKDALRVAVSNCWNVGSLSSAALATTVVVSVSMTRDGRPETGSIRLVSSSGGPAAAAQQAFGAARRAIIRCGANGYELPPEKYDQWRDIEMTFNPERMRIK